MLEHEQLVDASPFLGMRLSDQEHHWDMYIPPRVQTRLISDGQSPRETEWSLPGRLISDGQSPWKTEWSLMNSHGCFQEVTANDRSEAGSKDNSLLKDMMADLTPEEHPVSEAITFAETLINILKRTTSLEAIQAWPTDNKTIEFGQRLDADNQFILETGTKGITGFIRINGTDTLMTGGEPSSKLEAALDDFAQIAR